MRILFAIITILCLGSTALAKEKLAYHKDGEDTWLSTDHPENASYFAPKIRMSTVNDSLALWPGLSLGWIVGSVISVGFEGYILANHVNAQTPDTARFNMAVGGMKFEAIPSPEKRTHLVMNVLVGCGGSQAGGDFDIDSLTNHAFLVIEPGIGLEFNLTKSIRLNPMVSYLWLSGGVQGMESKWLVSETAFSLALRFKDPE
jgi:hypothetical protein